MTKKTTSGNKAKAKNVRVPKVARTAVERALKQFTNINKGLPIASIGLTDLANCDVSAGLEPLLVKQRDTAFFPVSISGHIAMSVKVAKDGKTWKMMELSFGTLGRTVELEITRRPDAAFTLVYVPAISHSLLTWETDEGTQILVLERWPSDPETLFGTTKAEPILRILKDQAARNLEMHIALT